MTKTLVLSLDFFSLLREPRQTTYPDPVAIAVLAEVYGVDGLVCQLRNDRRYIQERDIKLLRKVITAPLILKIPPTTDALAFAVETQPNYVVISPEGPNEDEFDFLKAGGPTSDYLGGLIRKLKENDIGTGLVVTPNLDQVKMAKKLEIDIVELHTSCYVRAGRKERQQEIDAIAESARLCQKLGMGVAAGFGLNMNNIKDLLVKTTIDQYWIGHSIAAKALFVGLEKAIREMSSVIKNN